MSTPNDTPTTQWQKDLAHALNVHVPPSGCYTEEQREEQLLDIIASHAPKPTAPTAQPSAEPAIETHVCDGTKSSLSTGRLDPGERAYAGRPAGTGTPDAGATPRTDAAEKANTERFKAIGQEVYGMVATDDMAQLERELAETRAERDSWKANSVKLLASYENEDRAHSVTVQQRDVAEDAADKLTSAILGEPIDWAFHDAKWLEAIEQADALRSELAELRGLLAKWKDCAEYGWTIIANAGGGNWNLESEDWQKAAAKFRDESYYPCLDAERARLATERNTQTQTGGATPPPKGTQ